jgi:hypothetical protein
VNNNATPGDTTDDFVVYTPAADFELTRLGGHPIE